jgi:hypothetical protein
MLKGAVCLACRTRVAMHAEQWPAGDFLVANAQTVATLNSGPTKLIHANFIFTDLSKGDRRLTPQWFYGHSCQGESVRPALPRKETP